MPDKSQEHTDSDNNRAINALRAQIAAQPAAYPKFMYHASKPPVTVYSAQQQAELGPDWSETYIYQEYPKVKHHWTKQLVTVKNSDEETALGGGWADTTTAFEPYRSAASARTGQQAPVKWVDGWSVPGLSAIHRNKIKAELWKADAAFWRSPDVPSAEVECMRLAFAGIAKVLVDARILTVELLGNEIPQLVWDSAIAGGWWRYASETPKNIFPEQIGHYWVWRDESRDWPRLFRAETAECLARLSEISTPAPTSAAPSRASSPAPRAAEVRAPAESISEVSRRKGLLADYKSGAGNPSNKRIYEARNSGIHKPQFYAWIRGELPADSETSLNFERFLREKKPPIPRKSRD